MSTETVMSWEMDSMRFGADSTPLTVRDVVERRGGDAMAIDTLRQAREAA